MREKEKMEAKERKKIKQAKGQKLSKLHVVVEQGKEPLRQGFGAQFSLESCSSLIIRWLIPTPVE